MTYSPKFIFSILWLTLLVACTSGKRNLRETYVVDEAEILTPDQEAKISTLCAELESRVGSQLVVNTVDSLHGETIEQYANRTFNEWKLGREKIDDGLLIAVAVADREVRIEVGYGLENIINDMVAAEIIDKQLVPNFKEGNYFQGILEAVKKVKGFIEDQRERIGEHPERLGPVLPPAHEKEVIPPR